MWSNFFQYSIIGIFQLLFIGTSIAQQADEPIPGKLAGQPLDLVSSPEPGLLFYLSADNDFRADHSSAGQYLPNYLAHASIISNGAFGSGIMAKDEQLITYWAPGNIYAQRGTISFYWRSRYEVGPTPFPIFRVGYADHKSWDMIWLRIDYNGSGFDAFVTDVGLSRTRVSYYMDDFPSKDEWTHIAFSWDEVTGVKLYVNGEPVAEKSTVGHIYDTGLDQFGPNSRIISPYQVQSRYVFARGGDLDELRIYDRMLSDDNILAISKNESAIIQPEFGRDFKNRTWKDAWAKRHGWNLPNPAPPVLPSSNATVKKVEIHEATDVRRWNGSALDGIRETTWPGVYNMSRLPGRYDYFVLPDWDAYSVSGQTIRFEIPSEPWNHIEMWGTSWGQLTYESENPYQNTFDVRSRDQVKSYHRTPETWNGGVVRFDNALIEEPIGEFTVYNVQSGNAPAGMRSQEFVLNTYSGESSNGVDRIVNFVNGRHPADERSMMIASGNLSTSAQNRSQVASLTQPIVHIIIPYDHIDDVGLDGLEISLPAIQVNPTHGELFPLNIRVKDPLWELRDMFDFSFSVNPKNEQKIWIDLRDRVLPRDQALYLSIAGAGQDFNVNSLRGAKIRLVYKQLENAVQEHQEDRIRQVKTIHAHNVEENPRTSRLNSFNRFTADLEDLLRVNPNHWLGKAYKYWVSRNPADKPEYVISSPADGTPEWAHLQVEYLKHIDRLIMFYVNERQIGNGEYGGGLSDDGDLTNMFPGTAFLGIHPEKIEASLRLHMEAYFDQDRDPYDSALKQPSLPLFTNGLATIHTDELHAYEDGIQVVGQMQLMDHGNPLYFNRNMHTAKRMLEDIIAYSPDGKRRLRSRYYGGTKISTEDPWQWAVENSYIMLHPAYKTIRHNGDENLKKMVVEIADMLLSQRDKDGNIFSEVNFETGETRGESSVNRLWGVFMGAYEYTGDHKYREPIEHFFNENREFNPDEISSVYREKIEHMGLRENISTEGSVWIDRVERIDPVIQDHRLGGVSIIRIQNTYPRHKISWKFQNGSSYQDLAAFVTTSKHDKVEFVAYNLSDQTTDAEVTMWEVNPGVWKITMGVDRNQDGIMDEISHQSQKYLERGETIDLSFESKTQMVVSMEKIESAKPYWERSDHAINHQSLTIGDGFITLRVHNIGANATQITTLDVFDAKGSKIASTTIPVIANPTDLVPKWIDLRIEIPSKTDLTSGKIIIDPNHETDQITRNNDILTW